MLKLTVDQIFPRKRWRNMENEIEGKKIERFHPVPKYGDFDNLWEFLCQIGIVKTNAKAMINIATKSLSKPPVSADIPQAEAPPAEPQTAEIPPSEPPSTVIAGEIKAVDEKDLVVMQEGN